MSVTIPSTTKNAINNSVSETVPLIGQRISTMPAAMPITPEMSDHQNPGALPHPKRGNEPDRAAEQKQPADEKRKGQRSNDRQNDCRRAEKHENDALNQKQDPMLVNRAHHRAPHGLVGFRLIHCHNRLPEIARSSLPHCQQLWNKWQVAVLHESPLAISGRLAWPSWHTYVAGSDVSNGSVTGRPR